MHRVNLPALPESEQRSPTGKFHSFSRNVSLALGGIVNTGTWGGGHPFDVQIRRIPSGAAVCPYHGHLAQWEMFVVLRGDANVRTPDGTFPARTGEVFFHPPGTPHQLINRGTDDLEVLIITDQPPLDSCFYPDSDKRSLRPPGKVFRISEAHYFDGEDDLPADAPPYRVSPSPAAPPVAPFLERKVHPEALPWESWASPKRTFFGESKELSIALGAKRNTPAALGGHPFDLELNKLRPGCLAGPFHSHAAEWEMFIILSGTARIRTNADTHTLGPGDVALHPPGEAHQISNPSDRDDLLYYLIADNAPVEVWHYPDSGKWGFRNPRKFFRAADCDYWDGEE